MSPYHIHLMHLQYPELPSPCGARFRTLQGSEKNEYVLHNDIQHTPRPIDEYDVSVETSYYSRYPRRPVNQYVHNHVQGRVALSLLMFSQT